MGSFFQWVCVLHYLDGWYPHSKSTNYYGHCIGRLILVWALGGHGALDAIGALCLGGALLYFVPTFRTGQR